MTTTSKFGCIVFAREQQNLWRVIGKCAVVACATILLSIGTARALTETSLVISSSPTSSVFGQSVTFTVTISSVTETGTPTGNVTFSFDDNTTGATGTLGASAANPGPGAGEAQAILSTSALPTGNLTITANYGGDSNFGGSSISTPLSVQKQSAGTAISSSTAGLSTFGESVTFTALVNPVIPGSGTPGGTVTFTVNGVSDWQSRGGESRLTAAKRDGGSLSVAKSQHCRPNGDFHRDRYRRRRHTDRIDVYN
jgi:hypothetical protein